MLQTSQPLSPTDLVCLGPALLFQGPSWNLAGPGNAQHYPPRAIYSHPQHPRNGAPPRPKGSPKNSKTAAPTLVAFVNDKAVLGLCFQGLHWQNGTTETLSTLAAQFEKWSKRNSFAGVNTAAKKIAYTMLSPEAQASIISFIHFFLRAMPTGQKNFKSRSSGLIPASFPGFPSFVGIQAIGTVRHKGTGFLRSSCSFYKQKPMRCFRMCWVRMGKNHPLPMTHCLTQPHCFSCMVCCPLLKLTLKSREA